LVKTQAVLSRKHLGISALWSTCGLATRLLLHGQTNFVQMLWKFNRVYHPERQHADHFQPVKYALQPPAAVPSKPPPSQLYVHVPMERARHAAHAEQ
jgi:hopanoid C-3 methylase